MATLYWTRILQQRAAELSRRRQLPLALGYPESVQLVPSNACNLRCSQCPKTYYDTDNRHLDPRVYERVRDQLFPYVWELNMQGLGEPTLSPLFWQMIEDAMAFELRIRFVSNGSFMGPDRIRRLVEAGVHLTISLDGARPETHEESRPGSRFDHLMSVFENFQVERHRQPDNRFTLCINTVVTRRNVGELADILRIAHRYGISHVSLINPGTGERDDEFARDAIGNHTRLLAERLPALESLARELGVGLTWPEFVKPLSELDSGRDPEKSEPPFTLPENGRLFPGTCDDPWHTVYIDVDGWVRPCCRALWIGMGNILQQPFHEIWNSEAYMKLRRSVNSNNPPSFCRDCNALWGINCGDEHHVQKLEAAGIRLPEPPRIGFDL